MRLKKAGWIVISLVLLSGCNHTGLGILRGWGKNDISPPQGKITSAQLVDYLNKNSERVQSLRCDDVRLRVAKGLGLVGANLTARLVCEQPRNFRMRASHALSGGADVDVGSNKKEFWFHIPKVKNAQIYCGYADLDAGRVERMPFPFQPAWVLETLGMSKYGPPEKYQLKETRDEIRLIERAKSPQGKPVRKVIVFNRRRANVAHGEPQVKKFLLVDDETGKEICSAEIRSAQLDKVNAAIVPKELVVHWPEENVSLTLRLINPEANVELTPQNRNTFFVRERLSGVPAFDLAQRRFDSQGSSVRRVRGYSSRD